MKRVLFWIIDHPWLAGWPILILTVVFAFQIPKLKIESSNVGLMVEKDPAHQYYDAFKRKFGNDTTVMLLVKADDVFTAAVLRAIQRLSDALRQVEGVTRVDSLTTVRNIKGEGDSLTTEPLVGASIPSASSDLMRIRADALGNRVFVGSIVSKDGKAAAIVVNTDSKPQASERDRRLVAQIERIVRQESAPGFTIYPIGGLVTRVTVGEFILDDLRTFAPVSVAVLFLLLLLAFRTLHGVVIPMVTGALSIVWTLGLMALFGLPVTVLTAIIPSLLLVVGSAEDVHMLTEYHHLLRRGQEKLSAIRTMAQQSALPITVTTATTVFGFASLITSDITMLIQFGHVSAMALTANFIITVVVLPIMLRIWPLPRRLRSAAVEDGVERGALPRKMQWLAEFNLRHRGLIAVVSALVVAASLVEFYRLRVDTDLITFFPEDSFFRQRLKDFQASLGAGSTAFSVVVETGREDGLKDPDLLQRIAGLQDFLWSTGEVDKTTSLVDYLRMMHRAMNGGDPAFETIPDTREEIAQYLLTLEGKELTRCVDFNASTAHILVQHHITGSSQFSALLKRLDAHVRGSFPQNVTVRYTGEAVLIRNASDYMAVNEVTSFGLTIVIIGLTHAWFFRSLSTGALSLVPDLIPVLLTFGLMGLLGIPLNPGTAMIVSIALGITVDDTVHHVVTYRRQLQKHRDRRVAMLNTMQAQGRPVIYLSVALAGGFFVLAFSNFVPSAQFGLLSGVVMLVAMVGELVLTPLVMYSASSPRASARALFAWLQPSNPERT